MFNPTLEEAVSGKLENLWSNDAEQFVLGAILASKNQGTVVGKLAGVLSEHDFHLPVHGRIYSKITDFVSAGQKANPLTLSPYFQNDPDLVAVGGVGYIAELIVAAITTVGIQEAAKNIRDLSRRRQIILEAASLIDTACDIDQNTSEVLSRHIASTEQLIEAGSSKSIHDVHAEILEDMKRPPPCYSTGIRCLDRAMGGGLYAGRVYGICGLAKAGKSLLAGSISYNLNVAQVKHAYIALEMGSKQIEHRQIARAVGLKSSMALLGDVKQDVFEKTALHAANAPSNTHYFDLPGASFDELRNAVQAAKHRLGCTGIIIDYWQLVTGRERGISEEEHLRRVAQWLASMASRLKLWVILVAQLADDGEATANSRTGMNKACDQMYFLRREAGSETAWLEQRSSRYTPPGDVGSKDAPSLRMTQPGPHFTDFWTAYEIAA